jgi:xanthine dehydrogenase YagS FAD-binding subunit
MHVLPGRDRGLQQARAGSGYAALADFNRNHAILGPSDQCVATHRSDVAVALAVISICSTRLGPLA